MSRIACLVLALPLAACVTQPEQPVFVGTHSAHASDAIYFVVTDRFVDGDASNNQPEQGTFDRPVTNEAGQSGNIGYLGGDFRGLLNNAGYIRDLGFGAVWLTPIVENPDEAFTGGRGIGEGGFADNGKTGYHGYWGVNFFELDEHLVSPELDFAALTAALRDDFGLATVLDIVCNHGSPSYTMPIDQPMYGEIYDEDGTLVADHQNLAPADLDPANPLHAFFHPQPDLAELSNNNDENPAVLDYFVRAYLKWIDAGASGFRIDTIRHMPHAFWYDFSTRIRAQHPDFFMFGESFNYDATAIAEHTYPANGGISVLDFPGQRAMTRVFGRSGGDFSDLLGYLHLTDGIYENPYDLMTFYDNHDMTRMDADDTGFIDANNWLFTSRGTPVVYYGSETAFRAGRPEHGGNRDYFGQDRIDAAPGNPIHQALTRVATLRRDTPALQRGLQVNIMFSADQAAFLRVLATAEQQQSALVVLNKSDASASVAVNRFVGGLAWRDALTGAAVPVTAGRLALEVPAHGFVVLIADALSDDPALLAELARLQLGTEAAARARQTP